MSTVGPSAANPAAQVQHPVAADVHVRVLEQILAVYRPELPLAGSELVDQAGLQTQPHT
jgi:hypothetical protein